MAQKYKGNGLVDDAALLAEIRARLEPFAQSAAGSSSRLTCAAVLAEPQSLAHHEVTAKGNLNIRRDGVDAARLISECRNIAFSARSACASGSGRPSHVLRAIGLTDAQAKSSIRLGFGRYTTAEEIDIAAEAINRAAEAML